MNTKLMSKITALATVSILLTACGGKENAPTGNQIGTYKVLEVGTTNTTLISEYPAALEGEKDIEIRPKIDGYIEEVLIDEGEWVKKGQLLFRIFNPQYGQDVESLSAAVQAAEAAVSTAELHVEKTKPLVEKEIISAFELQDAEIALQARKADLANAKARYKNAQANLDYTQIKSPVNGVVGMLPYRLGSYVNSATSEPLTRVSDISTIYAYFSIGEKQQLELFSRLEGTTFQEKIEKLPEVNLVLSNGKEYSQKGKIKTFSGLINPQIGSFSVRADFDNPENTLRSGARATLQIPQTLENVLVIPQKATYELQNKLMVKILQDDNTVKATPVKVRNVPGGQLYVVDEGLAVNDKILIEAAGVLAEGTEIIPDIIKMSDLLHETTVKNNN